MPRKNQARTIAGESNLAERIARERKRLNLSYEGLAKAMTEVGCSISGSALYRIEKGDPPRKVTVDELIALSEVFDESVEGLLVPVELIDQARAQELVATIEDAKRELASYLERTLAAWVEWYDIERMDADLSEFAGHRLLSAIPTGSEHPASRIVFDERFRTFGVSLAPLMDLIMRLENTVLERARELSRAAADEVAPDGQ